MMCFAWVANQSKAAQHYADGLQSSGEFHKIVGFRGCFGERGDVSPLMLRLSKIRRLTQAGSVTVVLIV